MKKYRKAVFIVTYLKTKKGIKYLILKRKLHWVGWEFPKGGLEKKEKKIQGAKSASKRKSISAHSVGAEVEADGQKKSGEKLDEDRELVMQGRRKKREFGGDLKNKICDDNVGSGMAEAAEQPHRPQ